MRALRSVNRLPPVVPSSEHRMVCRRVELCSAMGEMGAASCL